MKNNNQVPDTTLKHYSWSNGEKLFFPLHENPIVSIIIPVYNNMQLVMNCLKQIYNCTPLWLGYSVIIADDNSTEDILLIQEHTENVRIIQQPQNVGFIKNCNAAALQAPGSSQYIVFLNTDVEVQPEWLIWLLKGFEEIRPVGIVCPLTLYPDGKIESAGNILHKDGSSFCYGRYDTDIENDDYQYLKEVDYASASCLMIKTELWKKLQGFDEAFCPAYYEDTDLSLRARQAGYNILYQPKAVVIHRESQSYSEQRNALMQHNQITFLQRWQETLNKETAPAFPYELRDLCAKLLYFPYRDRSHLWHRLCIFINIHSLTDMRYVHTQLKYMRERNMIVLVVLSGTLKNHDALAFQQKGIHVVKNKNSIEWVNDFIQYFDTIYIPQKTPQRVVNRIKSSKKEQASVCCYDNEHTFISTICDIPLSSFARLHFEKKYCNTPKICSWYFPIISSSRVILNLLYGYIKYNLKRHKKTTYALITRKDIFPATEGAAVKIHNTAKQLSLQQKKTLIITSSANTYWLYTNGEGQEITYPYGLIYFTELFLKKNKSIVPERKIFPENEFWLHEYPKYDLAFQFRVFYLSCCYRIHIFQAEFFGFENVLTLTKKYIPNVRSLISQHNIESSRIPEIIDCPPAQIEAMKAFEVETCNKSNGVIVVSEEDKLKLLHSGIIKTPIYILPLGVDISAYTNLYFNCKQIKRAVYGIPQTAKVIVFHGLLDYQPNKDAAKILIEEIYPKIRVEIGSTVWLLIVGKHPPRKEYGNIPNIVFTGAVNTIAEIIVMADIAIVPLQAGGGLRLKILEYFAAKIPVISTAKGAEGLGATDGKEILLRETSAEISTTALELLNNQNLHNNIANTAYEFVKSFDWKEIVKKNALLLAATARNITNIAK